MKQRIRTLNPRELFTPNGFSHIAMGQSQDIVFISGQVAYNSKGEIIGEGCLATQTVQIFDNLKHALESVGVGFEHVIKLTFFVIGLDADAAAIIRDARRPYLVASSLPSSTMVGVSSLAKKGLLLEVEAQAILPNT